MSPVYEPMRWVDNALIDQQGWRRDDEAETGSKHVTVCFDQALPEKADAHLWHIEHRDRIRKSFPCLSDEMGKLLRRVVHICCQVPANPNILNGFERHYECEQNYKNLRNPAESKMCDSFDYGTQFLSALQQPYASHNSFRRMMYSLPLLSLHIQTLRACCRHTTSFLRISFPEPASFLHHLPATIPHSH